MKVPSILLRILPSIVFSQGALVGSRLRKHDRSNALQHAPFHPEHNPFQTGEKGSCEKNSHCAKGCFCGYGKCKHYGGLRDKRCEGQKNGADLGDGGFCWDGRRDRYCAALARKSNQKEAPENIEQSNKAESTSKEQSSVNEGADADAPVVEEVIDEQLEQAEEDADLTWRKARRMDPWHMFLDDMDMMLDTMMPGKKPNVWKKLTEMWLTFFGILWIITYRYLFYQDDRCPKHDKGADEPVVPRQDDPRIKLMKPDIVLVFHKPTFDYPDKESEVHASVIEHVLQATHTKGGNMPRAEALMDAAHHHQQHHARRSVGAKIAKAAKSVLKRSAASPEPSDHEGEDQDEIGSVPTEETTGIKMGDFRSALLQDFCEHLPQKGFDVAAFSSVDDDELFLCIGLRNELTVRQHLQRYGMKLQLQQEAAENLDIKQPPDEAESSPAYIRYDRRLAENVFGEGKKDLDVFKNWGAHSGGAVVISGADRIRIIRKHLSSSLNLDYAVSQNLLVQWYPVHNEQRIAELQAAWARWNLLSDLSVRQPLTSIRDYYGSRVAFIFGWMGCYTKMTMCLLPVALVWVFLNFVADVVGKQEFWHRGSVVGISVVIIIWAKLANNLWKKEEEFFTILWDLKHADSKNRVQRPDFAGVLMPDDVDGNKKSLQYPAWKYGLRMLASWSVTGAYCTFVFCCVMLWLDLFGGRMNLASSICQAIMIQIFTLIYNFMAEALTLAENHKFEDAFYSSYLQKMFIFQLVNQYSAFFYMAVKQQYTAKGCPDDDCVGLIQKTLPLTLLILTLVQFVQVFVGTLLVRFKLWYEQYQMKSKGMEAPTYSYVEEQSKYGDFNTREQIEVMTQLSLTLGYILIFGCVAPRIVPLCFLVFMIQLRASGRLMTTVLKRTVPAMTIGIEQWNRVFFFLMIIGVLFSAYLLVQFAPLFQGTFLITKLTGFFLYIFLVGVVWVCVDIACPPTDSRSVLLDDRRQAVEHAVMQIHENKNFEGGLPSDGQSSPHTAGKRHKHHGDEYHGTTSYTEEVVKGAFATVPKLIPTDGEEYYDAEASSRAP